jgi:2-polyprenyl-3-methyl-5-hydroxy-6-metoxy-1,4-benzoquinol methylase
MPRLAHAEELLDGPLDDPVTLAGNLRDLARANRWLGGIRLTRLALDQVVGREADRGAAISLLDVGTGGADIPLALLADWHRRGRKLEVTAVEHRAEILDAARRINPLLVDTPRLTLAVADGRSLPWPDRHFDVAHCSLVLHHLDERGAVALLREMARVSRRAVIVNDLARGRLFWATAWLLARLATRNRYTRHDAPQSVRRAWTVGEARALLAVAGLRPHIVVGTLPRYRWAIGAAVR